MIKYEHYSLSNGLQVILHPDPARPVVALSMLYKVGSRNDPPGRTGFAHLFEHLMFAGSENVENFDDALHQAGGENNAYTTSDYTIYYDVIPSENIETALWLESDRMRALNFSEKVLRTQQKVVVEEFKETCLEEPYGDAYHYLYDLAYQKHPYRWPVIGLNFADIDAAELPEVKEFFYQYYRPNNAILSLCGNFDPENIKASINEWFGEIPVGKGPLDAPFPSEPPIEHTRRKVVYSDVPTPAIYLAFPVPGRLHQDFYALDILAFLFGGGRSSKLYRRLVRDREVFHQIEAGMSHSFDPGLLLIEGRVSEDQP
ncbi:MAG: pitrilysin family protein, partial [Bacteroidota bacterium]